MTSGPFHRSLYYPFVLASALATLSFAPDGAEASTFRVSAGVGVTSYDESIEFQLSAGAGVFVAPGLLVHADVFGRFPEGGTIWRLSPGATYFVPLTPVLKPYIGAFYGRYFGTGGLTPSVRNSVGARAGAQVSTGTPLSIMAGVVFEKYLHDDDTPRGTEQHRFYPEISVNLTF